MLNLKPEAVAFLSTLSRCGEWHIITQVGSPNSRMAMALTRDGLVRMAHYYRRGKKQHGCAVYVLTARGAALVPELELAAINAEHPLECNCGVPNQVQCDQHGPRE